MGLNVHKKPHSRRIACSVLLLTALLLNCLFPLFRPAASAAWAEDGQTIEEYPPYYTRIGWWDDVYPSWNDGLTPIKSYNEYGFVNTCGEVVIPPVWEDAGNFGSGLAPVKNAEEKWGYINTEGELVIPCQWDAAADLIPQQRKQSRSRCNACFAAARVCFVRSAAPAGQQQQRPLQVFCSGLFLFAYFVFFPGSRMAASEVTSSSIG